MEMGIVQMNSLDSDNSSYGSTH